MRFKNKENTSGERTIKRFAFFPVDIDDTTIWIERYLQHQVRKTTTVWLNNGKECKSVEWIDVERELIGE